MRAVRRIARARTTALCLRLGIRHDHWLSATSLAMRATTGTVVTRSGVLRAILDALDAVHFDFGGCDSEASVRDRLVDALQAPHKSPKSTAPEAGQAYQDVTGARVGEVDHAAGMELPPVPLTPPQSCHDMAAKKLGTEWPSNRAGLGWCAGFPIRELGEDRT
jgi:hypothetical protein